MTPDDIRELVAVHALDALDPDEAEMVDRIAESDAGVAAELDSFRTVAAALGDSLADMHALPPPAVWAGIEATIRSGEEAASEMPIPKQRTLWLGLTSALAVAAAVTAFGLASRIGTLERTIEDLSMDELAAAAMAEPANLVAAFEAAEGHSGAEATIVLRPDGIGYLVADSLPALTNDRTYQLWTIIDADPEPRVVSAGVLGADPGVSPFRSVGDVIGLAITEEVAGGVPVSEGDTVAVWLRDP